MTRTGSPWTISGSGVSITSSAICFCSTSRLQRADRVADDERQRQQLLLDRELAGADPRHVEQVVDEARLHLDRLVDDVDGARDRRRRFASGERRMISDCIMDQVQRIAQLVRQRREEAVLQPVRIFELGTIGLRRARTPARAPPRRRCCSVRSRAILT